MTEQGNKFICFVEHNKDAFLALPPAPDYYKLPAPQATDEAPQTDIRNQLERLLDKSFEDYGANPTPPQTPKNTGKIENGF